MKQEFIRTQLEELNACAPATIKRRYDALIGTPFDSENLGPVFMRRRIAYAIQSQVLEQRLSEHDLEALAFLATKDHACDPSAQNCEDEQKPLKPGTVYTRIYKGKEHRLEIDALGRFVYNKRIFKSPTAAAQMITQTHTNGKIWWGISDGGTK